MKTGILIVSFGTTHLDTLAKTIQAVEEDLASAFPGASCYRAFTSGIVRSRLKSKYDITVDSVEEALTRMKADGVKRAVVQPTLLIPGEEYDRMRSKVLLNAGEMEIAMGLPLLWDDSDLSAVMEILEQAYPRQEDTVLLAMGHGTEHESNCLYVRLAQRMKERGGTMALCTVEGKPDFADAVDQLSAQGARKVHLVPLLLVAGDHSKNDMAGESEDSLRGLLEKAGFEVSWSLQGLGELPTVREIYVRRAKAAYQSLAKAE
ncbi:MAG: sirohydrochlorin cobaltochelatase [Oscillospiraceae bacterium]